MQKTATLFLLFFCFIFSSGAQTTNCDLVAGFTSAVTAPKTVHFQNTSMGLTSNDSIRWTFGDGTSSNELHPTHTYTHTGNYQVCLRIQKRHSTGVLSTCVREFCHMVTIENPPGCDLVVSFTKTFTGVNTVHFQNTSVGMSATDSIRWTFGDGTSSNQVSPIHTYAQPGQYNVCIRIQKRNNTGGLSTCVRELCHLVTVGATTNCGLVAGFTATLTGPNTYYFANTSLGLSSNDSIRWTFGDGTSSNQVSPHHTYAQPGQYNVCVRIQKRTSATTLSNCVKELCRVVLVGTPGTCGLVAGFTSAVIAPKTIKFQNTSLGLSPNDSIRWTFGDGTTSNQLHPTHAYTLPGNYYVCLRIQKRIAGSTLSNCVKTYCRMITIESPPDCGPASFTATQTALNTFHFQNTSVGFSATDSIRWSFGDGTSSNQASPTHTYAQPGQYNVCIRIQKRNNSGGLSTCVRELCRLITVGNTTNCGLVASFTAILTGPNTYQFANTSLGFTPNDSIRWTFGDGTSSNQVSPHHTYTQPGQYNVCIRIQKRTSAGTLSNCVKEWCHVITVGSPNSCALVAGFATSVIGVNSYHFQNTSTGLSPTDSIRWTFGDGTSSNQLNPTHTYAQPGRYNVCLRIQKRLSATSLSNCVKEICHVVEPMTIATCHLPYPNPATNYISVQVPLLQNQMVHVYIYNTSNILVKETHQQGFTGTNLVSVVIGDLVPGVYSMKVIHTNISCNSSFVKL